MRAYQGLTEYKHHRYIKEINAEFAQEIKKGIIKRDKWCCESNNMNYPILLVPKRLYPCLIAKLGGKLGRSLLAEKIRQLKDENELLRG